MGNFKNLKAWQQGRELSLELHRVLTIRRLRDHPGMRTQMLKAADSIPNNLAEGCARLTARELGRFAEDAYGSAKELENQLILCRDRKAISAMEFTDLTDRADHVARLCFGLMRRGREEPPREEPRRPEPKRDEPNPEEPERRKPKRSG